MGAGTRAQRCGISQAYINKVCERTHCVLVKAPAPMFELFRTSDSGSSEASRASGDRPDPSTPLQLYARAHNIRYSFHGAKLVTPLLSQTVAAMLSGMLGSIGESSDEEELSDEDYAAQALFPQRASSSPLSAGEPYFEITLPDSSPSSPSSLHSSPLPQSREYS